MAAAKRIVFDLAATQNQDWARAMTADQFWSSYAPRDQFGSQRLRSLEVTARGWRDKIGIVWLLDEAQRRPRST
jgi:hypothetical protein